MTVTAGEPIRIRWSSGDRTFPSGTTVTIGRDHGESIRLDDDRVSRHHAELRSTPDGWLLVDVGSTSGTFIGTDRVTQLLIRTRTTVRFGGQTSAEDVTFEPAGAAGAHPGIDPRLATTAPPAATVAGAPVIPPGASPPASPPVPPARPPAMPTEIVNPAPAQPTEVLGARPDRPGGVLSPNAAAGATEVAGAQLQVQFAGQSRTLNPGDVLRLGRDRTVADLVTDNPTVSREHARLSFQGDAWYLDDAGSSRGSFRDGRKVTHERITGTTVFHLGAPESGERLVVVAAGETERSLGARLRQPRSLALLAVAALVLAGLALTAVLVSRGGSDDDEVSVDYLRARTVRLSSELGSGTGSIIDGERGLILTNAHVVAPDAPGQGVNYPYQLTLADGAPNYVLPVPPKEIVVSLPGDADDAAEPRYIGKVVAADGYLDLAVVQITKRFSGTLVEEGEDLGLPQVDIGDSRAIDQNAKITVIGFPGVADSERPLVSNGLVSGFKSEDRLDENRAWINSNVVIGAGNSGGPAYDGQGRLVAVVTAKNTRGADQISLIRPIHLAADLIEAARSGDDYTSPFVTPAADEHIVAREGQDPEADATLHLAVPTGETFSTNCRDRATDGLVSSSALSMLFAYDGFPEGHQDVMVSVYSPVTGESPAQIMTNDVWPVEFHRSGCLAVTVPLGWDLQSGQNYLVSVDVGPNYEKNLVEYTLTVP